MTLSQTGQSQKVSLKSYRVVAIEMHRSLCKHLNIVTSSGWDAAIVDDLAEQVERGFYGKTDGKIIWPEHLT